MTPQFRRKFDSIDDQPYSIRIKSDLPFLLKKKWTRAKRDGGLSDPINHEVFGGDSLLPLACSIHLEIITFGTTIQIT